MVASTPVLDGMVKRGQVGAAHTLHADWPLDPESALLGVFGYDPRDTFRGRGPFEAASLQIDLDPRDLALSLNLITSDGERLIGPTAGRIAPAEARTLIDHLVARLRIRVMQFYPGTGYRNLMVWRDGPIELATRNPHEVAGEPLRPNLPAGDRAERLHQAMWDSYELLSEHPVNRRRVDEGKPPATMVWPWSGGRPLRLSPFGLEQGMGGAVVAGIDLVRGLARLAGLQPVEAPGATGYLDTDYQAKARAALAALHRYDFAAVHVEAPNEAALDGDYEAKVDAIERIDERLLGTILDRMGRLDDFRILLLTDHVTSCAQRRALPGRVPFLLTGNLMKRRGPRLPFDERAAEEAEWRIDEPWHVIRALFEEETT